MFDCVGKKKEENVSSECKEVEHSSTSAPWPFF